jgi:hypothetical protein
MASLPNRERAIVELRKIEDYCLSTEHPRGRHKARVFRDALGIGRNDAAWLQRALLAAVRDNEATELITDAYGNSLVGRHGCYATWQDRHGKNGVDCTSRGGPAPVCDLLGALMAKPTRTSEDQPAILDVVALLTDLPAEGLARGQVGTVVESLDQGAVLVEFSDGEGRTYAVAPCKESELLVLHYEAA